ncbi:MAG: hypothetical protein J6R39_02320, partial [Oscillospiraceae bacterium]|nr:hypothetical protein [Oscillospiraceae bacterium]
CLKSLSKQLLVRERTSVLHLVLRVFVTLFNLQGAHRRPRREFHSTTTGSCCQHLFSNFFELVLQHLFVIPALSLAALVVQQLSAAV